MDDLKHKDEKEKEESPEFKTLVNKLKSFGEKSILTSVYKV